MFIDVLTGGVTPPLSLMLTYFLIPCTYTYTHTPTKLEHVLDFFSWLCTRRILSLIHCLFFWKYLCVFTNLAPNVYSVTQIILQDWSEY